MGCKSCAKAAAQRSQKYAAYRKLRKTQQATQQPTPQPKAIPQPKAVPKSVPTRSVPSTAPAPVKIIRVTNKSKIIPPEAPTTVPALVTVEPSVEKTTPSVDKELIRKAALAKKERHRRAVEKARRVKAAKAIKGLVKAKNKKPKKK